MTFSRRLLNLRHFFKNNLEVRFPEEKNITITLGSEMFEDEMFIGSVFCNDLSVSQKVSEGKRRNQDTNLLNERFGIASNIE